MDRKIELIQEIVNIFNEYNIEYCIIGSASLSARGIDKDIHDIDILISRESYDKFYDIRFKYFRRVFSNIDKRITYLYKTILVDILVSGSLGAGTKIKFPLPNQISENVNGINCIKPDIFVEYKLTTQLYAMTNRHDFDDIKNVIKKYELYDLKFNDNLVQETYNKLVDEMEKRCD